MWLQLLLFDNPPKHGRVADQAARRYVEAFLHALQHGLGRLDLLGSMRGCRFDIHNDSGLHIDQISGRPRNGEVARKNLSGRNWPRGLRLKMVSPLEKSE
jgi:hypothetical protein